MDPRSLQRAAENAKRYPAAHSMDSGWFAVDEEGHVGHFDTGEGGAMPTSAQLVTGEATGRGEDGWDFVIPWLARQRGSSTEGLEPSAPFAAAFESGAQAQAASARFGESPSDGKRRVVEFLPGDEGTLHASVAALPGFIGFAPTSDDIYEDDALSERYPIVFYAHGTWEIPGEYVRRSGAPPAKVVTDPELLERAEHMATSFSATETIQLADFYGNEECESWSQADLRNGDMPEKPLRPKAQRGEIRGVIFFVVAFLLLVWFVIRMKG